MIYRLILSILLIVSVIGVIQAQEVIGSAAETVKNEILKIESGKTRALVKGGSEAANWLDRMDADDVAITEPDGSLLTKAQLVDEFRSGDRRYLSVKDDDYRVHVYANGNTAVVTYRGNVNIRLKGKVSAHQNQTTDVWIQENGTWRRVLYQATDLPTQRSNAVSETTHRD